MKKIILIVMLLTMGFSNPVECKDESIVFHSFLNDVEQIKRIYGDNVIIKKYEHRNKGIFMLGEMSTPQHIVIVPIQIEEDNNEN